MISKLVNKHDLPWLRFKFKMANSRFANLGEELLEADLSSKFMAGIIGGNMVDEPCNCNAKSLREDKPVSTVATAARKWLSTVWKIEILYTYTNKTYDTTEKSTASEEKDTATFQRRLEDNWFQTTPERYGEEEQSYGNWLWLLRHNHFAQICGNCTNSNHVREELKHDVSVELIWQRDPIKCTKSARTRDCRLCMVERKQIMQVLRLRETTSTESF